MASNTITTTRSITTAMAPDAARDVMRQAMSARNGKLTDEADGVAAKFGSQVLMRLIGGWLSPASWLPVRAKASFTALDSGTQIELHVGDAMGVGIKSGMNKKYESAVAEIANTLAAPFA
ncbi:MAG: hypothetical protein AB8G14_04315 [Ilumatobacter sp.]